MNNEDLDLELRELATRKNQLVDIAYHSEEYDTLEEELHQLEDQLMDRYGDTLDEAISLVHDEFCPDTEVLVPIAYIANQYVPTESGFDVGYRQGVKVELDDYPGNECYLVLVPGPTRLLLLTSETDRQEVWKL